jgi:hypothetical protein
LKPNWILQQAKNHIPSLPVAKLRDSYLRFFLETPAHAFLKLISQSLGPVGECFAAQAKCFGQDLATVNPIVILILIILKKQPLVFDRKPGQALFQAIQEQFSLHC